MISLLAVCHSAFFGSETSFEQRLYDSLGVLLLSAGISLLSGLTFCEGKCNPPAATAHLTSTFPVKLFFWTTGIMAVLFLLAWYLETHCIFYRDIHH